ncbi:hypothetical protein [Nocardia salmonicida]|uniref:hypothetical protein n=1 Tax=Nocardia salmonicida TaxID=53431 RepID=UPI00362F3A67
MRSNTNRYGGAALIVLGLLVPACSSIETSTPQTATVAAVSHTAAPTTTAFPEPPPYTVEVDGNQIRVATATADPADLLNTYNKVARTLRPTLAEGGYWVRINCVTGGTAKADNRLANGTIGVGKKGMAVIGNFGGFDGVIAGATCIP